MPKPKSSISQDMLRNKSSSSRVEGRIIEQGVQSIRQGAQPIIDVQKISLSIFDIFISLFRIIDALLMTVSYFLLVFQTVSILHSKQPKYINLRHISLKWLTCIFLHLIKTGFSSNRDINSQLIAIVLDLTIILVAYPSKILKSVHLKYFSHKQQQRYQDSVSDPHTYDLTFSTKIVISIAVLLLNFCKHLIAFVLPNHRRPIEDALRGINTVLIDRKCFWSIYNEGNQQNVMYQKDKAAIKEYLISGSRLQGSKSNINLNVGSPISTFTSIPIKQGKDIIKAYGQKCSNITANGFKPVKRVLIKYTIFESKLEILDLDFGKSQSFILEQLTQKSDNVLEFVVLATGQKKFSESIFIKFKNPRELQSFMRSIQESEKGF